MAYEALPPNPVRSEAEIAENLEVAVHAIYKMTASPEFQQACQERQVDPFDDIGSRPYLKVMADYGHQVAERGKQHSGDPLRIDSFDLMTTTPLVILDQAIPEDSAPMQKQPFLYSDPTTRFDPLAVEFSAYNQQVRKFVTDYPETSPQVLSKAMLSAATITIEDTSVLRAAPQIVDAELRGAKHGVAVGKILSFTGREVFPADRIADLEGEDFIVRGDNGMPMYVDAKASLASIRDDGKELSPYAIKKGGSIAVFSLCEEKDFGGKMVLSDEVAARKAPALDAILSEAQRSMLGGGSTTAWSA